MTEFQQPTVFISYAREDIEAARRLYEDLKHADAYPWFDKESLLPGQKWKIVIRQAIRDSRYFLAVLSSKSVTKRGFIHKELTDALELLDEFPESEIFIIPVRLDDCRPSHEKLFDLHWVDMFPSWEEGLKKILSAIGLQEVDEVVSALPTDPEELQLPGPSGGRQPRKQSSKRLIEKAGATDDFRQKRAIFEEVTQLDPGDPIGYRLLAWACQRMADYRSAIRYDRQALAVDPDCTKAYVGLIVSGNRTRNDALVDESWAALQRLCDQRERPFHEGAYWYADSQERRGNHSLAKRWFQHVTEGWWHPANSYEIKLLNDARRRLVKFGSGQ